MPPDGGQTPVGRFHQREVLMRDREPRRPMPVDQAILWKPLSDPHYVVASLQAGDGGRRKIFVRQQVLSRVEALAHGHGRRKCGLLVGQAYHCPVTDAEFLVIESLAEHGPVSDETEIVAAITDAVATHKAAHGGFHIGADHSRLVIGWYRGIASVEAQPSLATAAVHKSLFTQPWQTTLVMGETARAQGAAFFLHDTVNSRWFLAPFYELPDHLAKPPQPKRSVVNWPQYITADTVVAAVRELTAPVEVADVPVVKANEPTASPYLRPRPNGARPAARVGGFDAPIDTPSREAHIVAPDLPSASSPPQDPMAPVVLDAETPLVTPAPLADRAVRRPIHNGADVPPQARETAPTRRASKLREKFSFVDDRDQKAGGRVARAIADDDDTTIGDDPARYVELARSEGFFVAARFDAPRSSKSSEVLWVLNEPYSGLLLALVTTDSEIVDAVLHYNLQTDEDGLQRVPFAEHRDAESKTIYVRETCVEGLRARCRRLRATNALVREWRVTPTMSFLTPAEWESGASLDVASEGGAGAFRDLNNARIAELPEGVRTQFHLGVPSDASA
jgi:hypothetical protein